MVFLISRHTTIVIEVLGHFGQVSNTSFDYIALGTLRAAYSAHPTPLYSICLFIKMVVSPQVV
jgi:hypothetical protein